MFITILSITVVASVLFGVVGLFIDLLLDKFSSKYRKYSVGAALFSWCFWIGMFWEAGYFIVWCFKNVVALVG